MRVRRFLGEPDAAADERFKEYFVQPEELEVLLEPESHIIFGAKGVGKTALRRAVAEIKRDSFFATGTIDLDTLSFERVHRELSKLGSTTGAEVAALARATWRNVLAYYCLDLVRRKLPEDFAYADYLQQVLSSVRFTGETAAGRVMSVVRQLFRWVGESALEDEPPLVSRDVVSGIDPGDLFPSSPEMRRVLTYAAEVVSESGKSVVVCIDGFDSILDHAPESRKVIFSGLIDAIFRFSRDLKFSRAFCFKAFLPRELTHEAKAVVWDADKHLHSLRYLHWTEDALKQFIAKRLATLLRGSRRSDQSFEAVWSEFLPTSLRNTVHAEDEDSFDYILRHTQFRPRQLLFQVQSILNEWDRKSTIFKVDASFIPKAVALASRQLAEVTVKQLEYARPGIEAFLRSWGGGSSTLSFEVCFSKMKRLFSIDSNVAVRQLFDELFDFGVLGVGRHGGIIKGGPSSCFRFSYVGDGLVTRIQPADEDIVAMAPMFSEYFSCTPSEYGIVKPISV